MTFVITDKCCPSDWLDESVPALGKSPSDFLVMRDGRIWLVAIDDQAEFLQGTLDLDNANAPIRELKIGEDVCFRYTEDFGEFQYRLEPAPNGMAVRIFGEYPPHATHFGCPPDIIETTPEDAAREMAESGDFLSLMSIWYWSDSLIYTVGMDALGHPCFLNGRALQ